MAQCWMRTGIAVVQLRGGHVVVSSDRYIASADRGHPGAGPASPAAIELLDVDRVGVPVEYVANRSRTRTWLCECGRVLHDVQACAGLFTATPCVGRRHGV